MRSIKSTNTNPEIQVRKLLTRLGYRYRLNYSNLPGKPDIVFIGRKKAIFIHGCFWHHHTCQLSRIPEGDFWQNKIKRNQERDAKVVQEIQNLGWTTFVVWECELKDVEKTISALQEFLESSPK